MTGVRDPIVIYNERVKAIAGFMNAVGLGLIGFAMLRPLADSWNNVAWTGFIWAGLGLALHGVQLYILGKLKKDASK